MMCLNYKQYKCSLRDNGDISLWIMTVGYQFLTVDYLMDIPLADYVNLSDNYCGYGGTVEELIVNYVHPFFLKTKSVAF